MSDSERLFYEGIGFKWGVANKGGDSVSTAQTTDLLVTHFDYDTMDNIFTNLAVQNGTHSLLSNQNGKRLTVQSGAERPTFFQA